MSGSQEQQTRSQRWRVLARQSSEKIASFAEDVVLPPRNKRSLLRESAQDIELAATPILPQDIELGATPTLPQDIELAATPRLPVVSVRPKSHGKPVKEFPIFMLLISLIQILILRFWDNAFLYLGYDPHRRHEIWRFLTVMLVHSSRSHLIGNLFFQLILGVLLEIVHHWKRIGIIYVCGVLGGSLFITIINPKTYAVGASAGVFALLFAHVATILLNWNEMDNKCCRVFWLFAYIALDTGLTIYAELVIDMDLNMSHAGHFGGAVTGFLISILVLKNFEEHPWEKRLQKICAGILISLTVLIIIVNISFPSHYSKSEFNTRYEETLYETVFKRITDNPDSSSNQVILESCLEEDECAKAWDNYKNGRRPLVP